MKINKPLEQELDKQFPKGDKARGKALVLNAIANIELDKQKDKILEIIIKFFKEKKNYVKQPETQLNNALLLFLLDLEQELKQKISEV